MSPNATRQSTGKMTNRPHFAHIHGGTWDVPGILPGCLRPLEVFEKLVQTKKKCVHFVAPKGRRLCIHSEKKGFIWSTGRVVLDVSSANKVV